MGFSTHYLGRLDITPRLNSEEVTWLRAFALTDRKLHPGDPYAVPMNPLGEAIDGHQRGDYGVGHRQVTGLGRCDWEPCLEGCCLMWNGSEKSNTAVIELRYLVDHFLKPDAHAASDGRADFAPFTFDHTVNGVIAALRGDNRELFLIRARDNVIRTQVLVPGDPCPWHYR